MELIFFLTMYYWCFQAWVELTCSLVYTREEWKQLDIKWSVFVVFVIFVILLSSLFTRSNLIWSDQFLPLSFCCRYLCDLCHHNCVLAILLSSLLSSSLSSLVHTIEECKQLIVTSSLPSNWFTQELTTSQQPGTETSMKSLFSSGFPGKIWTLKCPHIILPFPNNIIIILITNVLVIKYWLTWQLWGFSNVLIFCHQILIILKSQISSSSF